MDDSTPSSAAFRDAFINQERSTRDVVLVRRVFVEMAGSITDGVLLSQIVYWYLPNKSGKTKLRVEKHSHKWIAKQHSEWDAEIGMKERQAKRALKRLSNKGLIETRAMRFNGLSTTHIRIQWGAFEEQYQKAGSSLYSPVRTKRPDRKGQNVLTERDETARPLTETTTEITTETTNELINELLKRDIYPSVAEKLASEFGEERCKKWVAKGYLGKELWWAITRDKDPPTATERANGKNYKDGEFADFWDE